MSNRLRKPNLLTLLGVALVVVTFLGVLAWTSGEQQISIYVADGDIPARRLVTEDMVTVRDVDSASVPSGAIRARDAIVGHYTVETVYDGETFTASRLATETSRTAEALSADLPANTRVLSVPADVSAALAGRIQAGDVVDIIAVVSQEGTNGSVATTLVQQALVLDTNPAEATLQARARTSRETDNTADTSTNTSSDYLPGIYTVALSPDQAQLVALAASTGELYLSLNPVGGTEPFEPGTATVDDLYEAGELTPLAEETPEEAPGDDTTAENPSGSAGG